MDKKRPCGSCLYPYEEHKVYKDMGNIFCPDQNLVEGPVEVFDCYKPCNNLQYLEYLDKQRREKNA